jgi:hypothetical protein
MLFKISAQGVNKNRSKHRPILKNPFRRLSSKCSDVKGISNLGKVVVQIILHAEQMKADQGNLSSTSNVLLYDFDSNLQERNKQWNPAVSRIRIIGWIFLLKQKKLYIITANQFKAGWRDHFRKFINSILDLKAPHDLKTAIDTSPLIAGSFSYWREICAGYVATINLRNKLSVINNQVRWN